MQDSFSTDRQRNGSTSNMQGGRRKPTTVPTRSESSIQKTPRTHSGPKPHKVNISPSTILQQRVQAPREPDLKHNARKTAPKTSSTSCNTPISHSFKDMGLSFKLGLLGGVLRAVYEQSTTYRVVAAAPECREFAALS